MKNFGFIFAVLLIGFSGCNKDQHIEPSTDIVSEPSIDPIPHWERLGGEYVHSSIENNESVVLTRFFNAKTGHYRSHFTDRGGRMERTGTYVSFQGVLTIQYQDGTITNEQLWQDEDGTLFIEGLAYDQVWSVPN